MKKLLIVEDNEQARKLLIFGLEKFFLCKLLSASNGVEALEIIAKESPDLILLDISMPVMDGIKVLENLRHFRNNDTIVFALTGAADSATMNKMQSLGISEYFTKPYRFEILVEKLEKFLPLKQNLVKQKSAG